MEYYIDLDFFPGEISLLLTLKELIIGKLVACLLDSQIQSLFIIYLFIVVFMLCQLFHSFCIYLLNLHTFSTVAIGVLYRS